MSDVRSGRPDYLFEVSWEVCNKVGGIHTVISSKALQNREIYGSNHIVIGPDVWMDTEKNPEFAEDPLLFRSWRRHALKNEELRVRVGRWNIPGKPVAILVDFTQFFGRKNEIFTNLWLKFGVDSISAKWDYIESALFGYASGMVIESFVKYNLSSRNRVAAQFHEWMSAAGILYIKERNLAVGTTFTTHATVAGRALAFNNMALYDAMPYYNGDEKAKAFNVVARHSLEKAAARETDIFTTVSEMTAAECRQLLGRAVDIVTPNGFDNSVVPSEKESLQIREEARKKLLSVASAMHGIEYPSDTLLVGTAGRYEYKNKGIDAFLDALGNLKHRGYEGRKIVAFLMVPASHNGADKELLKVMAEGRKLDYPSHSSHYLAEPEYDNILNRIKYYNLNRRDDNIGVVFVPSYLKGNDGVFNMTYYNLLSGLDLTLFPSYYEPWGYTPMESLAFGVPTVTTTLAGFGLWIRQRCNGVEPAVRVVERRESNYGTVVEELSDIIEEFSKQNAEKRVEISALAKKLSKEVLWQDNIKFYEQAYMNSMDRVASRNGAFPEYREETMQSYTKFQVNNPTWRNMLINKKLPERLENLDILSKNLWWCWNQSAIELFKMADPELWELSNGNPIAMLDMIDLNRYNQLANDKAFTVKLDEVYAEFEEYMSKKKEAKAPNISYFCMEYGLDTSLKIYSGGLGILAGDYLKEASDMNVQMTAVGFLYKHGYFTQKLSAQGDQVANYDPQDFSKTHATPVMDEHGNWLKITVAFPGRTLYARIWKVEVGRINLYLLDTDIDENQYEDRGITHQLYGGDWENRLKQELLLGVGGIRALRVLGIHSEVYHCNEGHAAFIGLERLREYVQEKGLLYSEALEVVRASSLFTTHTPVPAGHDAFSEDMLRKYIAHYPERLKIDWYTLMSLGKLDPYNGNDKFSMSNLAANLSQEVNGVSWLHGKVSQDILSNLWPGYLPEELHVDYVTNGVHYPTWTAPEWKELHAKVFGEGFVNHNYDRSCFSGIRKVSDEQIWSIRCHLKKKLIEKVKECLSDTAIANHYSPHHIVEIKNTLRDDILTIGFARRFATYKRAHLLFRDLDTLSSILNNPERPMQFIFAGKAHPADKAGQDLIKRIVEISKMPQFIGKIVFVPNYDITLAKYLVQGVDIWMNNPTRPLEASGTSGEKAVMNGVMHFSVLDGWWVEGYKEGAGWALQMERTYDDQNFQDELDAATIYNIFESDIAPKYYDKNSKGISNIWIDTIKNCVAEVACDFTTNRMMNDYFDKFYNKLAARYNGLIANDYLEAREIAMWKRKMRREWNSIEILNNSFVNTASGTLVLGNNYEASLTLSIGNEVNPEDIGVEILLAEYNKKGRLIIKEVFEYKLRDCVNGIATYVCKIVPDKTGAYQIAGRMYAKHKSLPHRQDFELVKWL